MYSQNMVGTNSRVPLSRYVLARLCHIGMSQPTFKVFRRSCPTTQIQSLKFHARPLIYSRFITSLFYMLSIFLAGWDFAIREPKYAKLNHSTLKTQLQLLLGTYYS